MLGIFVFSSGLLLNNESKAHEWHPRRHHRRMSTESTLDRLLAKVSFEGLASSLGQKGIKLYAFARAHVLLALN